MNGFDTIARFLELIQASSPYIVLGSLFASIIKILEIFGLFKDIFSKKKGIDSAQLLVLENTVAQHTSKKKKSEK